MLFTAKIALNERDAITGIVKFYPDDTGLQTYLIFPRECTNWGFGWLRVPISFNVVFESYKVACEHGILLDLTNEGCQHLKECWEKKTGIFDKTKYPVYFRSSYERPAAPGLTPGA